MSWFGRRRNSPNENPQSPQGLSVFASASSGNIPPLPTSDERFEIVDAGTQERRFPCGHIGNASFELHTYGEVTKDLGGCDLCSECQLARFKKFTIRCALCRLIILPGEGAALYDHKSPGVHLDIATKVGSAVIGCLRAACCPSGGFFAGNWTEEGFKPRFASGNNVADEVIRLLK